MGYATQFCFSDAVTDVYTSSDGLPTGYAVGMERRSGDNLYVFQQAGAAIVVNEAVVLDTSITTGLKVVKAPASTDDPIFGVAETAIASGGYGWITVESKSCSALVADLTVVGDQLTTSATAGTLAKYVPRTRFFLRHDFNAGAVLADGVTYKALLVPGFACTVKAVTLGAITDPDDGTSTVKVLKASSSGNTMLSAATYDPTGLTANTATAMTLTSTAADLALTAAQGVYVEFVAGTITTNPVGVSVTVEVEPTEPHKLSKVIALEANSTGAAAAKKVALLRL